MLQKIKVWVLMQLYKYHRKAGMYYFEKIDAYHAEQNEKYFEKAKEHWNKEYDVLVKLAIVDA